MAARDNRGSDERHSAANHVDGDDVETLPLIRRKLAEIRAEKIGKRTGRVDTFVPAGEGRTLRAFHDGRADDGGGQIAPMVREDGFTETFCERVGVGPAEMLRAAQADAHEPVACPARAIAFQDTV